MTRFAVISFIVVVFAVYCNGQPVRRCLDPNAVWNDCGRPCEVTCVPPKEPRECPALCVPKCTCKTGYVIGPSGRCITNQECARRIRCVGPGLIWNECGSRCEPLCIPPEEPLMCPAVCIPKCSCARGYIIGPNNTCITTKDCEKLKRCGQNEIMIDCGSKCEPTCFDPPHGPICTPVCSPKCTCRPGFVRSPNGRCILKSQCTAC